MHGYVLIIGGGGTGAAITHDLVQRGFRVTLVERGELTSGATGRHHGLLHSGARYAAADIRVARECMSEVRILQRIAPGSIEMNYGLFVLLPQDDASFADTFIDACNRADIPIKTIPVQQAMAMEPQLNPAVTMAVQVPDGALDAWRLPLQFFATARAGGADIRTFTEVIGVHHSAGQVNGVSIIDHRTGKQEDIQADLVINATGAWAGKIARLLNIHIPIVPAPGTMISVGRRLNNMIISRLQPAGDGDIAVSQRRFTIIGSTQWQVDDPDMVETRREDIAFLMQRGGELLPAFAETPIHAIWSTSRPLIEHTAEDGRKQSRDFMIINHEKTDNLRGIISVIGGKATLLRLMGEKTADMVCSLFGKNIKGKTAETPLLSHREYYRKAM